MAAQTTCTVTSESDSLVWLYDRGRTKTPFHKWREQCLPSRVNESDGVAWIYVTRGTQFNISSDKEGLKEAWDEYLDSEQPVNYEIIERLARDFHVTSGKWMIFTDTGGKVDHIWSLVSSAIIENELNCHSTKVSTNDGTGSHVICMYNYDFTNKEQVFAAEQDIRNIGYKGKLLYKPDVFTHLGIYSGNEWNMTPNIWVSNFDVKLQKSVIASTVT